MKFLIVFVALFAFALAAPPQNEVHVNHQDSEVNVDSFKHSLELSDGTKVEGEGKVKTIGEEEGIATRGSYSWVDPEGQTHTVTYIADENGYQPQGADIPVAPVA